MAERCPVHSGLGWGADAPKAETLRPLTLAICCAHTPPWRAGAFIYDHLGRVEQTYVAEGRLFLFIKFMALPRLHTVKTGRIGPKVSYRMTASDVRTSVNSVGAVEGNKAADNSEARCPVKRWGAAGLEKRYPGAHVDGEWGWGLLVATPGGIGTLALPGDWMPWVTGWRGLGEEELESWGLRGSGCRTGSWREFRACGSPPADVSGGERNADSALLGGGIRFDLSEGRSGNTYPSRGNVCPSGPATPRLRISPKERDSSVESQGGCW